MLLTTTPTLEGKTIKHYRGVVAGEAVMGADILKDLLASLADFTRGRASGYERTLEEGRAVAFEMMKKKAAELGADAIVGINVSYQVLGAQNGMLMVAVSGTAVITGLAPEPKKTASEEADELACYYLQINAREKGPFSKLQLRAMLDSGGIQISTECRLEDSEMLTTVAAVLGL